MHGKNKGSYVVYQPVKNIKPFNLPRKKLIAVELYIHHCDNQKNYYAIEITN